MTRATQCLNFKAGRAPRLVAALMYCACAVIGTSRALASDADADALTLLPDTGAGTRPGPQRPAPKSKAGRAGLVPHIPILSKSLSMVTSVIRDPILRPVSSIKRLALMAPNLVDEVLIPSPLPSGPTGSLPPIKNGPGMDLAAFERFMDREFGSKTALGEVRFLIDGEEYFKALNGAVERAKESIEIRTYIFDNDDVAVKFADLLRSRSGEIRVKVMYDRMGSIVAGGTDSETFPDAFDKPKSIKRYLKSGSKVRVRRIANPWLAADHTKTIIIDRQMAFLGGMNIGREYRYEWHDLMVEVKGPVVDALRHDFDKAWRRAGPLGDLGSVFGVRKKKIAKEVAGGKRLRVLCTIPGKAQIYKATMGAIKRAQSYIYIENAYLTDNRILRALAKARQRGVDVRVVFPAGNDNPILKASNLVTANALHKAGIRVYLYPGMSHVKAMAADGWAIFGSANLDFLSLKVNRELNLATSDPEIVGDLVAKLFEKDFSASEEMTAPVPVGILEKAAEIIANQL